MSKEKDALSVAWYLPESNQEPVAWFYDYDGTTWVKLKEPDLPNMHHSVTNIRPLYTSPPTREPLSAMKILEGLDIEKVPSYKALTFQKGVRWAEAQHNIGVSNEY